MFILGCYVYRNNFFYQGHRSFWDMGPKRGQGILLKNIPKICKNHLCDYEWTKSWKKCNCTTTIGYYNEDILIFSANRWIFIFSVQQYFSIAVVSPPPHPNNQKWRNKDRHPHIWDTFSRCWSNDKFLIFCISIDQSVMFDTMKKKYRVIDLFF